MPSCHTLDRLVVTASDRHAVANAGLILPATLAARLDLETAANQVINLGGRPGHFEPGAKVLTLIHALLAGGDCIDDADVLRCGATEQVLGHRVVAPSTLGTFLRSFTFGNVRQLDRLSEIALGQAWAAGAGPGAAALTLDLDSTVAEVHGDAKQGAAYGYTRVLGYHPLLATRADTGELLHVRMRKGSAHTARGASRFVTELVGRVRRAGGCGALTVRADSGFFSHDLMATCRRHEVRYSITVRMNPRIRTIIAEISESSWVDIDYTDTGIAQVAEAAYDGIRLIVRRTRILGPQAELFPDWRLHALVTDRGGEMLELEADHRRHAVVELAIRDLKEGAGLRHCPSGRFHANGAWLVIAALAHNLLRWVAALGFDHRGPIVAKTLRRRVLSVPGRLTRSARRWSLALPRHWPWAAELLHALDRLRALPRLG